MPEPRSPLAISDCFSGRLVAVALLLMSLSAASAGAVPFTVGDILVGLGSSPDGASEGEVRHFSPAGDLLEVLFTTSGSFEQTGMCLDGDFSLALTTPPLPNQPSLSDRPTYREPKASRTQELGCSFKPGPKMGSTREPVASKRLIVLASKFVV